MVMGIGTHERFLRLMQLYDILLETPISRYPIGTYGFCEIHTKAISP